MKIADIPARFNVPFANSAGGGYVRTIPEASQVGIQNGAASLETGFPPLNWLPVGAGGVPPFGQDMNGIIKQITQWSRWQGAGNATPYNSAFSTAVGGYPLGAILSSPTAGVLWLSTVDDNTSDPDAGGAGWTKIVTAAQVQSGALVSATAAGTANALSATLSPAPASLISGMTVTILAATDCTGSASLDLNALGAKSIVRPDLSATQKGDILAGQELSLTYNGTFWQINNPATGVSYQNLWVQQTHGTYTFTAPRSGYYYVTVIGAGGGGGSVTGSNFTGGSGGGGGLSEGFVYLTANQAVTVTVGQGGVAVNNSTGNAGTASSFGAFMTATAGTGGKGQGDATMQGGFSGVGANGTINYGLGDGDAGNLWNGGGGVPLASGKGGGPGGQSGSSGGFNGRGPGGGGGGGSQGFASGSGADGMVSVKW